MELKISELHRQVNTIKLQNIVKVHFLKFYNKSIDEFLKERIHEIPTKEENENDILFGLRAIKPLFNNFQYESLFPSYHRYSLVLLTSAYFETELNSLCDEIHNLKQFNFKVSDLKGNSFLEKFKLYIKRTVDLNVEGINSSWKTINDLQKLRSLIIHANGSFKIERNDICNLIGRYDSLTVDNEQENFEKRIPNEIGYKLIISDGQFNMKMIDAVSDIIESSCDHIIDQENKVNHF
jgi:hypothetical protein